MIGELWIKFRSSLFYCIFFYFLCYNKSKNVRGGRLMPHLKVRGLEKKVLIEKSKEIIDGLTEIIQCDRTWFTIEHIDTEYIFDGKIQEGYSFIELYWFERGEKIKKRVAAFLTEKMKEMNGNKDACVIFFPLLGENYCDNGVFF